MKKREPPKHRFQRWCDNKIICTCGWESMRTFSAAISELAQHIVTINVRP